jgi:hypothetical protein
MKKGILMTLFGAFVFIYYLVLTLQSYSKYDDGWGTDISMDMDLVVKTLVGLTLLICGIVVLVKIRKHQDTFKVYNTSINVVGLLMCIYPLGLMFKSIAKHKSGSVIVDYLIWAIFGAFILAYGIISYIEHKKKIA